MGSKKTDGDPTKSLGISRRGLVAGVAGSAALLAIGAAGKAMAGAASPVRPPGSQSEDHFIGACIRCNRCRGACPRKAIVNCDFEDGMINIRTPRLDFRAKAADRYSKAGIDGGKAADGADPYQSILAAKGAAFCDFCMLCAKSCPTGALADFDPRRDWIGEAVIEPAYCIAFEKLGGCRKCADYCPFEAITIDESRYPVVDPSKCNGCGICENICPSATYRTFKGAYRRGVNIVAANKARPL
jgi:ferredoxin-type protein NapG